MPRAQSCDFGPRRANAKNAMGQIARSANRMRVLRLLEVIGSVFGLPPADGHLCLELAKRPAGVPAGGPGVGEEKAV